MEKVDTGLNWIDRTLQIVDKYKFKTIFKAIGVIFLIAAVVGFISNPTWIFEKIQELEKREHSERMEITLKNTQIINGEIENLRYRIEADRVILLQFHNSKESLSGLPFIYLTATAEAIDYDVKPVADGYEAVKTSLYPFMTYISKEEYFCGDIEDLREIDKALAYRMLGNDVKHVAFQYIEGEYPLGILVCTFTEKPNEEHSCLDVEHQVRKTATKIGILLNY